jgi:hypothetical protein
MYNQLEKNEKLSLNEVGTLIKVLRNDTGISQRFYLADYDLLDRIFSKITTKQKNYIYALMDSGHRIKLVKLLCEIGLQTREMVDETLKQTRYEDSKSLENNQIPF